MAGRNILDANQAYQDMLGYTIEELRKQTFQELTPSKWHEMEDSIVRNQIRKREYSDEYEKEYIRKDGTVFPISIRAWLTRDDQGKSFGMWGTIRDITELKRIKNALEASEEKYRTLAESAMDAIYVISTENGFEYVNPAFERLFGYVSEEICHEDFQFLDLVYPDDKILTENRRKAREKGKKIPSIYQFRGITKAGVVKYVEVNTVVLPGKGKKILGILRDRTDLKQAELQLRKSESELRKQKLALEQKNIALREVIAQVEMEKIRIQDNIETNINL